MSKGGYALGMYGILTLVPASAGIHMTAWTGAVHLCETGVLNEEFSSSVTASNLKVQSYNKAFKKMPANMSGLGFFRSLSKK